MGCFFFIDLAVATGPVGPAGGGGGGVCPVLADLYRPLVGRTSQRARTPTRGGLLFLLGPRGVEEGELRKYLMDWNSQRQFLLEADHQCQEAGFHDKPSRELISEQQIVLRQLEAVLLIDKLVRAGQLVDDLSEITKLSFLPLNPRGPDVTTDVFRSLPPHVQACVPDLLIVALRCADNVADSEGTLRVLRSKIINFVANSMTRSWPQDLYERVARSI